MTETSYQYVRIATGIQVLLSHGQIPVAQQPLCKCLTVMCLI